MAFMVRKKKTKLFHDEIESRLAESRLKMLKTFLLVAGISLAASMVGYTVSNVLWEVYTIEESVSFLIGFFSLIALFIAAIGWGVFGLVCLVELIDSLLRK